jgi:hypothetical protein
LRITPSTPLTAFSPLPDRLKLESVDAPVEQCTRQGLRAMTRTRWCHLCGPANFRTDIRKRKWRDEKANADGTIRREIIAEECWAPAYRFIEYAEQANAVQVPRGAPWAVRAGRVV